MGRYSQKSVVKGGGFGKKIKRGNTKCFFQHFRWVEDQKVGERIVEIWPSVIKIMNHWIFFPPSKQLKFRSYEVVKGAINDPFTVTKLKFFCFTASPLEPYLTIYQSEEPLIPFLYDDLQSLYKELLGLTVKSEVLEKCENIVRSC